MFGGVRRGLSVLSGSLDVFRANPRLAVLPACSLLIASSALAAAGVLALNTGVTLDALDSDPARYVALFAVYAVGTSVAAFFNAAVVHCAARHFDGEHASVRDGLRAAWRVRRGILAWAAASATIGVLLHAVENKLGPLGDLSQRVFGVAWTLLTFFVVPVVVLEETTSVRRMVTRSTDAFTDTWGESVTVTFGIGAALLPVAVAGGVGVAAAWTTLSGPAAWIVGAVGVGLLAAWFVAGEVLGMVARTALYRYATDGERVGPFADRDPGEFVTAE